MASVERCRLFGGVWLFRFLCYFSPVAFNWPQTLDDLPMHKGVGLRENKVFDENTTRNEMEVWRLSAKRLCRGKIKFATCSSLVCYNIYCDLASVISELHDRVTAEIKRQKGSYPDIDETAERTKYAALGLCEDNAYLQVRGHNLYDLIVRIGESLCYELKKRESKRLASVDSYDKVKALYADGNSFKKEVKKAALFTDYPEIAKCILDMQTIWPPFFIIKMSGRNHFDRTLE